MRSFSAGAVVIATLALHTEGSAVAKENSSDRGGVREVGRKRTQHKEPRMDGRRTGGHRQILNKGGYAYEYGYGYGYGYKDDDESGCDTLDCLMAEVDEDVTQINLSEEDRSVSHVEPWAALILALARALPQIKYACVPCVVSSNRFFLSATACPGSPHTPSTKPHCLAPATHHAYFTTPNRAPFPRK